jgi:hypothetical protein
MEGAADDDRIEIVVVARVARLGTDALCAFIADGAGSVRAAVNADHEGVAVGHIQDHLARGAAGVYLCGLDCSAVEREGGRPAPT